MYSSSFSEQEALQSGLNIFNPETHFTYRADQGEKIKQYIRDYYGVPNMEVSDELVAVFAETEECGFWAKMEMPDGEIESDYRNMLETPQQQMDFLAQDAHDFYDYFGYAGVNIIRTYKSSRNFAKN